MYLFILCENYGPWRYAKKLKTEYFTHFFFNVNIALTIKVSQLIFQ